MLKKDVSLIPYSNYRIGGKASYFFESNKIEQLSKALNVAKKSRLPIFVLGGGTNILFSDAGFSGLVVKTAMRDVVLMKDNLIKVGAGATVADLIDFAINHNLSGLEWAGGLPGTVGGAIRGNAGAFGGEIKDIVAEVVSLNFSSDEHKVIKRDSKECCFGYRDSIFKSGKAAKDEIILEVVFQLSSGNKNQIRQAVEEKILWRKNRQPLDYPNVGSIFKNVDWRLVPKKWQANDELKKHIKVDPFPVLPAAALIDKCGFKGVSFGGAMVSQKHPNFIVNALGATASDVKALIELIKSEVFNRYQIKLEEEIILL